jgi:hypothetical protein
MKMKKTLLFLIAIVLIARVAYCESWIKDYGYWENKNEISAKKDLIGSFNPDNIFDFNTSKNQGGEKIEDGKYYIPISYNGGYNGTDTDYIYVEDLKGKDGTNGLNGKDGVKGDTGLKGDVGDKGEKGIQGTQGKQGKGLEDRYEVIGEVRLFDTRKTAWSIYAGRDFNNDNNIFGAKVTIKLGKSYEEKRLDELEAKINNMIPESSTQTIVKDEKGNIISMSISNNHQNLNVIHNF